MTERFWRSGLVRRCLTAMLVWVVSLLTGCQAAQERPTFERVYREVEAASRQPREAGARGPKLSIACQGVPLHEILRYLAQETGASIVAEQGLDVRPVSLEVYEQELEDVLGVIARRVGVEVSRTGSLYFIGHLRSEDKGVLVRRATRLNSE